MTWATGSRKYAWTTSRQGRSPVLVTRHGERRRRLEPDLGVGHPGSAVGHLGVGQAEAERQPGIGEGVRVASLAVVDIGADQPARRSLVGARRDVAGRQREGHRQPAVRGGVARQHVGEGAAGLDARVPGHDDRVGQVEHLAEVERSAGVDDHDQGLAEPGQAAQQVELPRWQAEVRDGVGLAGAVGVLADQRDGDVGEPGELEGAVGEAPVVDGEPVAEAIGERGGRRHDVLAPPVEDPRAEQHVTLVRERAGEQHRRLVAQGEGALVADQHVRSHRGATGEGPAPGGRLVAHGAGPRCRGTVEEAEPELHPQDAAAGVVDQRLVDLAVADQVGEVGEVRATDHVEVDPGLDRQPGGLAVVAGDAREDDLPDAVPVADDDAVEAPLALEHVAQQVAVRVHRHAVDVVERGHHAEHAGLHRGPERPQVQVAQGVLAHRHGVVVAASRGQPVADEVLGARAEPVGPGRVVALEALGRGGREPGREHGRLAERLRHPAPARFLGQVEHRREGPGDPVDDRLGGGVLGSEPDQLGVEGRRQAERDRRHGAVTVDHVAPEEHRDPEAALACEGLDLVDHPGQHALVALVAGGRAGGVQARADAAVAQRLGVLGGVDVGDLVGLAHLVVQGHLGHQRVEPRLDVEGGVEPGAIHQKVSRSRSGEASSADCRSLVPTDAPARRWGLASWSRASSPWAPTTRRTPTPSGPTA